MSTESRAVRVVVAESDPSARETLRFLINAEPDLTCVGVVRDGRHCLTLCRELSPDVLVLTDDLIGVGARVLAPAHAEALSHIRVVMYARGSERIDARGVAACVSRDEPYEALFDAIRGARTEIEQAATR